jgi:hypothetical protein
MQAIRAYVRLCAAWLFLLSPASPAISAETSPDPQPSCFALAEDPVCIREASYTEDVCRAISIFADHWSLPEAFFARLIWQESRFDPQAISPAGAQGIAQFMAGTARLRALENPFDPAPALAKSAEYLRDLELKYGNLGLAAAAYNSGEGRISRLVDIGGGLPLETRQFVSIITGRPIDYWLGSAADAVDYALHPERDFHDACIEMAKAVPMPDFGPPSSAWQPWGVLIAQNFSRNIAVESFQRAQARYGKILASEPLMLITVRNLSLGTRLRYSAMVGRQSRREAEQLCRALVSAGGNCIVQKNGS